MTATIEGRTSGGEHRLLSRGGSLAAREASWRAWVSPGFRSDMPRVWAFGSKQGAWRVLPRLRGSFAASCIPPPTSSEVRDVR